MVRDLPPAEKIRFTRGDICNLSALPSAEGQDLTPPRTVMLRRVRRWTLGGLAAIGLVVLLAVLALKALSYSELGQEHLRQEAEAAIERMAGMDVQVTTAPAHLAFDGFRLIAVEVPDVTLRRPDGVAILEGGTMSFGVRLLPLLTGKVRLSTATVSDARVVVGAMPDTSGSDWLAAVRDTQGRIDSDKVLAEAFAQVNRIFDAVGPSSIRELSLDGTEFLLPGRKDVMRVKVKSAEMSRSRAGQLELVASVELDGRRLRLEGTASRDDAARRITTLDLSVKTVPGQEPDPDVLAEGHTGLASAAVTISGAQGVGGQPDRLVGRATLGQAMLGLGNRGLMSADLDLSTTLEKGAGRLAVDRLAVTVGRSIFDFKGAIAPAEQTGSGAGPAYRFEMVSADSQSAPDDSPEPPVQFIARIAGIYDVEASTLTADEIGVKSGPDSDLLGKGSVQFVAGKTPGIFLALNAHQVPVSHGKQFWPWFSAHGARGWVLQKLFGGTVSKGELQVRAAPGRIGDGTPLNEQESFGNFEIVGTRFDVAGRIPPVRDADGAVSYAGSNVDISLSSGTVFLPSGRTVAASNGTLKLVNAHIRPQIGKLDIDVAGNADAIIELTSYDPINAMKRVGLTPEELSGEVKGHVRADIPLAPNIDASTLDWLVTLNYTGLSVAKPFSGQTLTDADGTVTVSPLQAVIEAKGRLNGIPATLSLSEPLREGQPPRSLNVALELDDKARNTLVPGLSKMLAGTVKVKLNVAGEGQPQRIEADLTRARLDLPWVGWSKGQGIPGSASFVLARDGAQATLSDFKLDGPSFGASGTVSLANGALSSARFERVQLNREDNAAVTIRREGRGYAIAVNGRSLDVRPLVKQFMADETGVGAKSDSGDRTPVSISAEIDTLVGFYDERLSDVTLNYAGSGSSVAALTVKATSQRGGTITMSNGVTNGQRRIEMRSSDAGAVLRFLNVYERMHSGGISLVLSGPEGGTLTGKVDARDFVVVNEPRLASLVSSPAPGSDRSLSQAVKRRIDTTQVKFELGAANIEKGPSYLAVSNGIVRGADMGTTFQGVVYDRNDQMNLTGTFMPAYGLNSFFGDIPIVGAILGNGSDRGLIGVTYKLSGSAKSPALSVNPLSAIAPGIFRSIFEY